MSYDRVDVAVKNYNVFLVYLMFFILMCNVFVVFTVTGDDVPYWDENWSFRQLIVLPVNTSDEHVRFQPVDMVVYFENLCWAKNEDVNSVRVCVWDGSTWYELESQIYDLSYVDEEHVDSCRIVFLVPEWANGKESYYVYYDDEEKSKPGYVDHVKIDEGYYRDESIPGFAVESSFYEISQDGYVIYAVSYAGKGLGYSQCHQVTKMKTGSLSVQPSNGDQLASFNLIYWYRHWDEKKQKWQWTIPPISADKLVKKKVLVDGNLMTRFLIVSRSPDGRIKTGVTYTYYYSPGDCKRLRVHVKNEIVRYDFPETNEIDVTYVLLKSGGFKSKSIPSLNFGRILPFFHVYTDDDMIKEFMIDTYPDGSSGGKQMTVISKSDDVDVGDEAWVSVDEGANGVAHGIIFNSTEVVKSGMDERQGVEIQLLESRSVLAPGLEMVTSDVYLGRNSYEPGEPTDEVLPPGFVVEFDAEFFSAENGGYKTVEKEAVIYRSLFEHQPFYSNNENDGNETEVDERFTLTT